MLSLNPVDTAVGSSSLQYVLVIRCVAIKQYDLATLQIKHYWSTLIQRPSASICLAHSWYSFGTIAATSPPVWCLENAICPFLRIKVMKWCLERCKSFLSSFHITDIFVRCRLAVTKGFKLASNYAFMLQPFQSDARTVLIMKPNTRRTFLLQTYLLTAAVRGF